jgi:hypothetical protein
MAFNPLKGVAQGVAGYTLRKVAGNLPGLLGFGKQKKGNSDTAPLSTNKYHTKNFSFPMDIGGLPGTGNQGHYMMFFVNQQTNSKMGFGNKEDKNSGSENMQKAAAQQKIPSYLKKLTSGGTYVTDKNKADVKSSLNSSAPPSGHDFGGPKKTLPKKPKSKGSTITIDRPATVRMDTAITLYMPQTVSTAYGVEYANQEVGDATQAGANFFRDVMDGKKGIGDALVSNASKLGKGLQEGAINKVVGLLSIIPGVEGAKDVFQAQRGFIKAPKMELFFRGVGPRKFQYVFKMIPKSRQEMQEIRNIVASFKLNMLPEFADGNRAGRSMTVPNTFDIQYMYQNAENNYLHKISTCYLSSMDVSYGGSRYKTFDGNADGAPPVETSISLNFKEIELITRERAAEGF